LARRSRAGVWNGGCRCGAGRPIGRPAGPVAVIGGCVWGRCRPPPHSTRHGDLPRSGVAPLPRLGRGRSKAGRAWRRGLRGDGTTTGRLVRERPADLGADTTHAEVETVGGKEEEKVGQVRNGVKMTRESRPYPHVHVTAQCRPAEYVWKHPRLSSTGPPPSCSPFA
jgi:hypothetical protein